MSPSDRPFRYAYRLSMLSMTILLLDEADHAFVEPAVAYRLDEVFLAERLEAFQERRPDQALLVGAVTAVARGRAPGAKAVHRVGIHLVAVHDRVQRGFSAAGGLSCAMRLPGAISVAPTTNTNGRQRREFSHCFRSGKWRGRE